jgi:hypothetical protein
MMIYLSHSGAMANDRASEALAAVDGNVERAIDWLLAQA